MELTLDSLDYSTGELKVSGKVIVITSSLNPKAIKASSKFNAAIDYAKENDIELYATEDIEGIPIRVVNEQYKKLNSMLAISMVSEWPFDDDMKETLLENQDICNAIQNAANRLAEDFLKKKDS